MRSRQSPRDAGIYKAGPTPAAESSEADRQPAPIFYPNSFTSSFTLVGFKVSGLDFSVFGRRNIATAHGVCMLQHPFERR